MFPTALVSHVDSDISYHLTILLKCSPRTVDKSAQKKRFMFENIWFTEPSCKEVVSNAQSSSSNPDAMMNLLTHLNKCSVELILWNRQTFGHVDQNMKDLEQLFQSQHDTISLHKTLGLIRDWRKKEKILWWQQAHSDCLKDVDSKTRWFHIRANMKRSKNMILGLKDVNGDWRTEDGDIANIVVRYFRELFTTSYHYKKKSSYFHSYLTTHG